MKAAVIVAYIVGGMGLCASLVEPRAWFPSLMLIGAALFVSVVSAVHERAK